MEPLVRVHLHVVDASEEKNLKKPILVLRSLAAFSLFVFISFIMPYAFIEGRESNPNTFEMMKEIVYITIFVSLVPYGLWTGSYVIEVYKDSIVRKKGFGIFGEDVFYMKNIKQCRTRVNSNGRLTRVVLQFRNGKNVQFHQFQSRFMDALFYLRDTYPQIMDAAVEDGPWSL